MTLIALYNDALAVAALVISASGIVWTVVELALRARLNRLPDDAELQRRMLREIRERVVAKRIAAAFCRDIFEGSKKMAREFGVPWPESYEGRLIPPKVTSIRFGGLIDSRDEVQAEIERVQSLYGPAGPRVDFVEWEDEQRFKRLQEIKR